MQTRLTSARNWKALEKNVIMKVLHKYNLSKHTVNLAKEYQYPTKFKDMYLHIVQN